MKSRKSGVLIGYQINQNTPSIKVRANPTPVLHSSLQTWVPTAKDGVYQFIAVENMQFSSEKSIELINLPSQSIKATHLLSRAHHLALAGCKDESEQKSYNDAIQHSSKSIIYMYDPFAMGPISMMTVQETSLEVIAPNYYAQIEQLINQTTKMMLENISITVYTVPQAELRLHAFICNTAGKQNKFLFTNSSSGPTVMNDISIQFYEIIKSQPKYGPEFAMPFITGRATQKENKIVLEVLDGGLSLMPATLDRTQTGTFIGQAARKFEADYATAMAVAASKSDHGRTDVVGTALDSEREKCIGALSIVSSSTSSMLTTFSSSSSSSLSSSLSSRTSALTVKRLYPDLMGAEAVFCGDVEEVESAFSHLKLASDVGGSSTQAVESEDGQQKEEQQQQKQQETAQEEEQQETNVSAIANDHTPASSMYQVQRRN